MLQNWLINREKILPADRQTTSNFINIDCQVLFCGNYFLSPAGLVGCITDLDIKNHIIPSGGNSEIHFGDDSAGKLLTYYTEGFNVQCQDQCPDRVYKKKSRQYEIRTTPSSIINEEETTTALFDSWFG